MHLPEKLTDGQCIKDDTACAKPQTMHHAACVPLCSARCIIFDTSTYSRLYQIWYTVNSAMNVHTHMEPPRNLETKAE